MSTTPSQASSGTSTPKPNIKFKVQEYTTPNVHISSTTAPLTSHIIIDAFEDKYKMHSPEMTFMQNSLSITHRKQNISLVFSTPEAILGTIHPESTTPVDQKPSSLSAHNETKKNDPKLFIPRPVQVQASQQWQKHLEKKQQLQALNSNNTPSSPHIEETCTTVGDWTYSSLYQGQLYINHRTDQKCNLNSVIDHFEGFFTPQFPFSPAKLHNTLTPDTEHTPQSPGISDSVNPSNFGNFDGNILLGTTAQDQKVSPPPSPTTKQIATKAVMPTSPSSSEDGSAEPATSQFLQHLSKLVPKYDLLTQQTSPEQALVDIPSPELEQFNLDAVSPSHWSETDVGIDYRLLSNKSETIDFYSHLILFEDELHDNGTANYTIRIRVMKSCYYVLVRNFLRVDDVVVRIRDTRYFYPFIQHNKHLHLTSPVVPGLDDSRHHPTQPAHDWLYRETKVQEATFEQLRAMRKSTHSKDYTEEFAWVTLPTLYFANHRIDLNQVRNPVPVQIPE